MMADESLQPSFGKKMFSEILATASLGKTIQIAAPADNLKIGLLKGKPSVSLSKQLVMDLSAPFKNALVGKFSQGRPMLEDVHSYLVALDLKGQFQLGILDARHVIINFQMEDDFHKLYSRKIWYFGEAVMRIFKWTTDFHVDKESPVVPIWIELEKLPIFLFNKEVLFAIASTAGLPIRLDAATAALKKPSVARIQVEINLLKERPDSVWIGTGDDEGFWQTIKYCNVPYYCTYCSHVGHDLTHCHIKNPNLRHIQQDFIEGENEQKNRKPAFVYRAKERKDAVEGAQDAPDNSSLQHMNLQSHNTTPRELPINQIDTNNLEGNLNSGATLMENPALRVPTVKASGHCLEKEPMEEILNNPQGSIEVHSSPVLLANKFQVLQEDEEAPTDFQVLQEDEAAPADLVSTPQLNTTVPLDNALSSEEKTQEALLEHPQHLQEEIRNVMQQVYSDAPPEFCPTIVSEATPVQSETMTPEEELARNTVINEGTLSPRKMPVNPMSQKDKNASPSARKQSKRCVKPPSKYQ